MKKSIADLGVGTPIDETQWDYSHLLSDKIRAKFPQLKLTVIRPKGTMMLKVRAFDPTANIEGKPGHVGDLDSVIHGDKVNIGYASIDSDDHVGHGIGKAMYEAVLAHAHNNMGLRRVAGGEHSTFASKAHRFLRQKHGTKYKAVPNIRSRGAKGRFAYRDTGDWEGPPTAFDDRFQGYDYTIDPLKKALSDIRAGKMHEVSGARPTKHYDYSHLINSDIRNKYNLEVRDISGWPHAVSAHITSEDNSPIGSVEGVITKRGDTLHVVASMVSPEHRSQGLGNAAYEAILAHAKNIHNVSHVMGASHSEDAHKRHMALARKHGLTYESTQEENGKYSPYHYALKFEQMTSDIEIPLAKTEDHIENMLRHGDIAERALAIKNNGVEQRHLIMALADRSKQVVDAVLKHPAFTAETMRQAPPSFFKKYARTLLEKLEDRLYAHPGGPEEFHNNVPVNMDGAPPYYDPQNVATMLKYYLDKLDADEEEPARSHVVSTAMRVGGNAIPRDTIERIYDRAVKSGSSSLIKMAAVAPEIGPKLVDRSLASYTDALDRVYGRVPMVEEGEGGEGGEEEDYGVRSKADLHAAAITAASQIAGISKDQAQRVFEATRLDPNNYDSTGMHLEAARHLPASKLNSLISAIAGMEDLTRGMLDFIQNSPGLTKQQLSKLASSNDHEVLDRVLNRQELPTDILRKVVKKVANSSVPNVQYMSSDLMERAKRDPKMFAVIKDVINNSSRLKGNLVNDYVTAMANKYRNMSDYERRMKTAERNEDTYTYEHAKEELESYANMYGDMSPEEFQHLDTMIKEPFREQLAYFPQADEKMLKGILDNAIKGDNEDVHITKHIVNKLPDLAPYAIHNASDYVLQDIVSSLFEGNATPEMHDALLTRPHLGERAVKRYVSALPDEAIPAVFDKGNLAINHRILSERPSNIRPDQANTYALTAPRDEDGYFTANLRNVMGAHELPEDTLVKLNSEFADDSTVTQGILNQKNTPKEILLSHLTPESIQQAAEQRSYGPNPVSDLMAHPRLDSGDLDKVIGMMQGKHIAGHEKVFRKLLTNPNLQPHHISELWNKGGLETALEPGEERDERGHNLRDTKRSSASLILGSPHVPTNILESAWNKLGMGKEILHTGYDGYQNPEFQFSKEGAKRWGSYQDEAESMAKGVLTSMQHHNPEFTHGDRKLMVRPGSQKLRRLRDMILDSGQEAVPMSELPKGNLEPFRVITGDPKVDRQKLISANKIQQYIDNMPAKQWYFDTDKKFSYGLQQHTSSPSNVFMLHITPDQIAQLKNEGLWQHFRHIQKKHVNSLHPQHNSNGIGWIRWTGNPAETKSLHVDEIQADLHAMPTELKLISKKNKMYTEDGYKTWLEVPEDKKAAINAAIEKLRQEPETAKDLEREKRIHKILFQGHDPHEILLEGFHNWAHANFGRTKIHWPGREMRATLSGLEGYDPDVMGETGVEKGKERFLNYLDSHYAALKAARAAHARLMEKPVPDPEADPVNHRRHLQQIAQSKQALEDKEYGFGAVKRTIIGQMKQQAGTHGAISESEEDEGNKGPKFSSFKWEREVPVKYEENYEKLPVRSGMNINAAKYGDEPSETNMERFGGMNMHVSEATKKESVVGIGEALMKSIADIKGGKLLTEGRSFSVIDMSHLLSRQARHEGYGVRLTVSDPRGKRGTITADIHKHGNYVGGLTSYVDEKYLTRGDTANKRDVEIELADVEDGHQGKGLGTAAYEAVMGAAKHIFNATHVKGTQHSSLASKVHQKLAAKHGMSYKPVPNVGGKAYPTQRAWEEAPSTGFDAKYKAYKYTLKSELRKSFKGLNVPPAIAKDGSREHKYDYSHMLPAELRRSRKNKLIVRHAKHRLGDSLEVHFYHDGQKVGEIGGSPNEHTGELNLIDSGVDSDFRGMGVGKAMYEAAFSHAVNALKLKHVTGDFHSDDARFVHQSLANKHNLNYQAGPNIEGESTAGELPYKDKRSWEDAAKDTASNARWGRYKYTIDK